MEIFFGAFTSDWEQRRAALLHEMTLGGRGASAEDELEKRLKRMREQGESGGGAGGSSLPTRSLGGRRSAHPSSNVDVSGVAGRPMEVRLSAVAMGSQPAVVKMASYGGGARVGSMLNYVSRSGELKVENENGERLQGREEIARIRGDWDYLFQNRTESRDIGAFSVEVAAGSGAEELHERVRNILSSGFGGRRYAYAVEEGRNGSLKIDGYVVLRSGQGERLTADEKAARIVQERFDASAIASEVRATFSFGGYGNGVEYGSAKVRALIEDHGEVRDDRGLMLKDGKAAGDLVQKEWRDELHSRKSRDVMHVIMSARAGTDAVAFEGAVRDFLAQQFAGHRYVFAMHDPENDPKEAGEGGKRPHVHAHAIVTMRSESGDRIETTPATFRQWREVMAEKARDHGIKMEMTDRREFATPPAFTRNQVRAVNREGRTEHVGTSEPAQARYDAKRSVRRTVATSQRSRQYAVKAQETWQKIAVNASDKQTAAFATEHRSYLESGLFEARQAESGTVVHADFGRDHRANMLSIRDILSEAEDMREQTRQEFEVYEKTVETALFRLERGAGPDYREGVEEVTALAREIVDIRRQMLELKEHARDQNAEATINAEAETVPGTTPSIEPLDISNPSETDVAVRTAAVRDAVSDQLRESAGASQGDPNAEWDAAVAKHGEAVVEAGNDALLNVEHFRRGLAYVEAGEFGEDSREQFEKGLERALEQTAQLALSGNSYVREVAAQDPELRAQIEKIEAEIDKIERFGSDQDENQSGKQNAVSSDATDERQRDLQADRDDEHPEGPDEREVHELAAMVEATQKQQDRVNKDREAGQRSGDTTRTDPAQQHIPRLEELERGQVEQRERHRDDRER